MLGLRRAPTAAHAKGRSSRAATGASTRPALVGGVGRVAEAFADLGEAGCTDVIVRHLADDHDEVPASFGQLARYGPRSTVEYRYGDGAPLGRQRIRAGGLIDELRDQPRYGLDHIVPR